MESGTKARPISSLSFLDLRQAFGVERDRNDPFFKHWLADAEVLSPFEQHALDRLRQNYRNIIETNPLEEVVKLVVVAPLLDLAGFYQPPFSIRAEVPSTLTVTEDGQVFTGKIDVLVIKRQFWILVIESKQAQFDVSAGIPQAIGYLLNQPLEMNGSEGASAKDQQRNEPPRFGMVTNGREVVFLKGMKGRSHNTATPEEASPVYSQSTVYQVIDEEEDLPQILQGLKWIGKYICGGQTPNNV